MKSSARVVVIGGGVGCSVLCHLAKNGWSDVMQSACRRLGIESHSLPLQSMLVTVWCGATRPSLSIMNPSLTSPRVASGQSVSSILHLAR
jgi:glycine/D-amino acid oxidase-like deaminating enzyme